MEEDHQNIKIVEGYVCNNAHTLLIMGNYDMIQIYLKSIPMGWQPLKNCRDKDFVHYNHQQLEYLNHQFEH